MPQGILDQFVQDPAKAKPLSTNLLDAFVDKEEEEKGILAKLQQAGDESNTKLVNLGRLMKQALVSPKEHYEFMQKARSVNATGSRQAASDISGMLSDPAGILEGGWEAVKRVGSAIKNSAVELYESDSKIADVASGAGSLVGGLASLPFSLVGSIVDASSKALVGVDLSKEEGPTVASAEQSRQAAKAFVANTLSVAIGVGASQGLKAGMGALYNTEKLASQTLPKLVTIGGKQVKLGIIGQTVLDDAVGTVAGGSAMGMIQEAGDPNKQGAALITNLAFAPLGTMFGYVRGAKLARKGLESAEQTFRATAIDIAHMRQLNVMEDASLEEAMGSVMGLVSGDYIAEATVKALASRKSAFSMKDADFVPVPAGFNKVTHKESGMSLFVKEGTLTAQEAKDFAETGLVIRNNAQLKEAETLNWLNSKQQTIRTVVFDKGKRYDVVKRNGDMVTIKDEFNNELTVPRERLNGTSIKVEQFETPYDIETLYKKFKSEVDESKPFDAQLAAFVAERGLEKSANHIRYEVGRRYAMELAGEDGRKLMERVTKFHFSDYKEDIIQQANRNGMYIDKEYGSILIRDAETGEIFTRVNSVKDAEEFLRIQEGPIRQLSAPDNALVPNHFVQSVTAIPKMRSVDLPIYPNKDTMGGRVAGYIESKLNEWNVARISSITTMRDWARSMEAQHPKLNLGLNLIVRETEEASARATHLANIAMNQSSMREISRLASGLKPERLDKIGQALEAANKAELSVKDGYSKSHLPEEVEFKTAEKLVSLNVRSSDALTYMRKERDLALNIIKRERKKILDSGDAELGPQELYDSFYSDVRQHPDYIAGIEDLRQRMNVTPQMDEAVQALNAIVNMPNGQRKLGFISRYQLALLEDGKSHLGMSRADFMKRENFTHQERVLVEKIENAYRQFGSDFGIKDDRQLRHYMQHYRSSHDLFEAHGNETFIRNIGDNVMSEFVSNLIRTGEIATYEMNPVLNLATYVRAGYKNRELYPVINSQFRDADGAVMKILSNPALTEKNRIMIKNRMTKFMNDVTGHVTDEAGEVQQAAVNRWLEEGLGQREILKNLSDRDKGDMVLSISNMGNLGGRPVLGLRDYTDIVKKYYIRLGDERLGRLLKTRMSHEEMEEMLKNGLFNDPELSEFYNLSKRSGSMTTSIIDDLAKFSNDVTGQPYVYLKMNGAVRKEAMGWNMSQLQRFSNGELDLKGLRKQLKLASFDPVVQKRVMTYLEAESPDQYFKLISSELAAEEAERTVGRISRGNRTPLSLHPLGKFMGQMSSWANANRTDFFQMFTRAEDARELAKTMARYALSETATLATGRIMGLNMGRWLFNPATMLAFSGGPVQQFIASGKSVAENVGGSESQMNYAVREFKRNAVQFVPWYRAVEGVARAAEEVQGGASQGKGIMNAIGFKADWDTQDTFLDAISW